MDKSQTLTLRISLEDKRVLQEAARLQRIKLSEFVLRTARDNAHEVIAQQTRFVLSEEQMQAFTQALDAPPREIPELRRLLAKPRPWDLGT